MNLSAWTSRTETPGMLAVFGENRSRRVGAGDVEVARSLKAQLRISREISVRCSLALREGGR